MPLQCGSGCVLRMVVMPKGKPLTQSEVLRAVEQIFIEELSILCFIQLPLYSDQFSCPCCWKAPQQHEAATTMLHYWDGIVQVMNSAWFPIDIMFTIKNKLFNLVCIRPEKFFSQSEMLFLKTLVWLLHIFGGGIYLATLPHRLGQQRVVVIGCPFRTSFPSLHRISGA